VSAGTLAVTGLDGLAFGLLLVIVAAGLTLIFGVMNVLNLAHGSLYLGGAYLAWALTDGSLLALAAALAVGAVIGAASGALLTVLLRPIPPGRHLDQALLTLGLAFCAGWGFTRAFGAAPLPADPPLLLAGRITLSGHGYPVYRLVLIAVAALIAIGLHLLVRHTHAGMLLRAAVADPVMASATGIRTGRVRVVALAVGGALTTFAGVLGAPLLGPAAGTDTHVLTMSLIIVVLGGAGSIPRTVGAALLVGQVQTVGVITLPVLSSFLLFAAVLFVLLLRRHQATTVRPV
jgi:branched-subunit amino acid ABC-type transport system permease component